MSNPKTAIDKCISPFQQRAPETARDRPSPALPGMLPRTAQTSQPGLAVNIVRMFKNTRLCSLFTVSVWIDRSRFSILIIQSLHLVLPMGSDSTTLVWNLDETPCVRSRLQFTIYCDSPRGSSATLAEVSSAGGVGAAGEPTKLTSPFSAQVRLSKEEVDQVGDLRYEWKKLITISNDANSKLSVLQVEVAF